MNQLTTEQKAALLAMKADIRTIRSAMYRVLIIWKSLEETNSPIGFMDNLYPFEDNLETTIEKVTAWQENVRSFITSITQ